MTEDTPGYVSLRKVGCAAKETVSLHRLVGEVTHSPSGTTLTGVPNGQTTKKVSGHHRNSEQFQKQTTPPWSPDVGRNRLCMRFPSVPSVPQHRKENQISWQPLLQRGSVAPFAVLVKSTETARGGALGATAGEAR